MEAPVMPPKISYMIGYMRVLGAMHPALSKLSFRRRFKAWELHMLDEGSLCLMYLFLIVVSHLLMV
jgi:hypothetical protein